MIDEGALELSIPVVEGERRAGDPAQLVADSDRAKTMLGWTPQYADLSTIVTHAWQWEQVLTGQRPKRK